MPRNWVKRDGVAPSVIREATGLTPTQIATWDSSILCSRRAEGKHRRVSPRELFCLLVCAELRERYDTNLPPLVNVGRAMLGPNSPDYLLESCRLLARGQTPWIATDCDGLFMLGGPDVLHRAATKSESVVAVRLDTVVDKVARACGPQLTVLMIECKMPAAMRATIAKRVAARSRETKSRA